MKKCINLKIKQTFAPLTSSNIFKKEKQFTDAYLKLNQIEKGFYIERLVITVISLGILKEVAVHTIKPRCKIEESPKTKLVPIACDYPGFDFFYYWFNSKTVLFHQVNKMKKCHQNIVNDKKASSSCYKAGTLPPAMRVMSIDFYIPKYNIKTKSLFSLKDMGNFFYQRTLESVTSLLYAMNELDSSKLARTYSFIFLEEFNIGLQGLERYFPVCAKNVQT